ncbi:MAG: DUF1844 domain-containing protein [bacterium]
MSEPTPPAADDKHRTSFIALVLLLREMSLSLLHEGRRLEARGLIDSIEALKSKTKGNLDAEEAAFLDDVLYGLHLEAVKTPAGAAPPAAAEAGPGVETAAKPPPEESPK